MTSHEFSGIRHRLGKTQAQMAQLLGISLKSLQSFEQGWRKVTVQSERQALFLLAHKEVAIEGRRPCWEVRSCRSEVQAACPAREFSLGNLCWFVNGTHCEGKPQPSWQKKMKICRECQVFRDAVPVPPTSS